MLVHPHACIARTETLKLRLRSEPTHQVHLNLKHAMAKRTLAHRIQYVEWNPTAISSIAVSPDNKYLACGRNNGRVEIWNIDNDFHMERVIPGREGTMISCLQWYQPPLPDGADMVVNGLESNHVKDEARLFASGLHGEIYEIDPNRLRSKHATDSYGGAVWEFVVDNEKGRLYAACDDGSIRKFNVSHGALEYEHSYPRTDKRLLTICLQNDTIYAAGEEGIIRSWNKTTGGNVAELHSIRESAEFKHK